MTIQELNKENCEIVRVLDIGINSKCIIVELKFK